MSDRDGGRRASATRPLSEDLVGPVPGRVEIAIYIAELATELARISKTSRLPAEMTDLLEMTAVLASELAGCPDEPGNMDATSEN